MENPFIGIIETINYSLFTSNKTKRSDKINPISQMLVGIPENISSCCSSLSRATTMILTGFNHKDKEDSKINLNNSKNMKNDYFSCERRNSNNVIAN